MQRYKKVKRIKNLLLLLSIGLTYIPILSLAVIGFIQGQPGEKFSLGVCVTISIILLLIQILNHRHFRCTLWILLLGIYMCLNSIAGYLLVIAICTILDDLFIRPLYQYYKGKYDKIDTAKEVAQWKQIQ